ncbi:MAG: hypothetical protein DHS20C02_19030 [Micavibrio sp.]|nr:MAG: hypothetical protein DHS20C02_19030 [Micavibrio sp.]
MKPMKKLALSAGILMMGLGALPMEAHADNASIQVNSYNPGTIDILSNGSAYIKPAIPLVSLSAQLGLQLDAGDSGRVKSWKAWVKVKRENGPWIQFTNDYDSASYSIPRPKTVLTVAPVNVPYGTLAPFAISQCNALANTMRGAGLSDMQIFSQDRVLTFAIDGALSYEMSGVPGSNDISEVEQSFESHKKFHLHCKAAPQPEPEPTNPTRNIPDVDQASVSTNGVSTLNGACKLNLSGVIVTKEANTQVKFRYKDGAGHQSDIKTVVTDQTKTIMFNHKYDLAGTGLKTGKIRIDIEGETVSSPWSHYNVNCVANSPGGLVGGDGGGGTSGAAVGGAKASEKGPSTAPTPGRGGAGSLKATPKWQPMLKTK